MRILIVLHQFYPEFSGGTERVSLNLAHAAQRAGHYVHVLACSVNADYAPDLQCEHLVGANNTVYQGIPVTLLPRNLLPASADFSLEAEQSLVEPICNWMKQQKFDVCHAIHPMRMSTAILAAQRCGLPIILTLTDFFLPCPRINFINLDNQVCGGPELGERCVQSCLTAEWSRETLIERYAYAKEILASASIRVAPSEFVAQRYRIAFPDCSFRVISHGIDLLALNVNGGTEFDQKKQGNKLRLGYVGAILPQKGLDILLRAFSMVDSLDVELTIIGGFYCSPNFENEVLELVKLDPRIELLGHLDPVKVFNLMRQFDLLCLPSQVPETFSLVLHEAAALGVPALVSDLGAPNEQVTKIGGGQVVAAGSISAWTDAICSILSDPGKIEFWQSQLPLPVRVEEEGFYYEALYKTLLPHVLD